MARIDKALTVGKTPLERVLKLLSKLHSIRVSQDRGSLVSNEADDLFHKYVEQVASIFKNLPKPLKLTSFQMYDLILLTDIPLKVQKVSGGLRAWDNGIYKLLMANIQRYYG